MLIGYTNKQLKCKHKGFTLVELMVSTAVAAISMAGVLSVFANSVESNTDSLQQIRLNQELRAIMGVMSRDIRRAGYWANANGVNVNPFANGTAAMTVVGGDCITYSYDLDADGAVSAGDLQGIKRIGNTVNLIANANDCSDVAAGDWEEISDADSVAITNLNFNLNNAACINLTDSDRNCNNALVNDQLRSMSVVTITLSGQLVGDASVSDTLTETVTVRNTLTALVQ